jgi:CheY-like chemotaxis protein
MTPPKLLFASRQKALESLADQEGLLASLGFRIITAHSAKEAISKFMKERPDVAVLDYELPSGGGIEVASEMLQMKPSTKIIVSTRVSDKVDLDIESIGIDIFLPRSSQNRRMLESILALCGLRSAVAIVAR